MLTVTKVAFVTRDFFFQNWLENFHGHFCWSSLVEVVENPHGKGKDNLALSKCIQVFSFVPSATWRPSKTAVFNPKSRKSSECKERCGERGSLFYQAPCFSLDANTFPFFLQALHHRIPWSELCWDEWWTRCLERTAQAAGPISSFTGKQKDTDAKQQKHLGDPISSLTVEGY